jgi:hypothetical protein
LNPCCRIKGNGGINCLNDNSWIVDLCNRVGRFDGSCNVYNYDAANSLIHGYTRQEDEPFSFLLAASYPWQSS